MIWCLGSGCVGVSQLASSVESRVSDAATVALELEGL